MKKFLTQTRPVKLINPLNQEEWICENYKDVVSVEGVDYIKVQSKVGKSRTLLMRKDALRKVTIA